MSIFLRALLLVAAILTCLYIARKLRKSQVQVMDAAYWIGMSVVFIFISIFTEAVSWLSEMLGFQAPVNFIFLVMIFLLLIRCFLLSIRVSQLEGKMKNLIQEIAIRDNMKQLITLRGESGKDE